MSRTGSPLHWESQHKDDPSATEADVAIQKVEHLVWTFAIILRPADVAQIPAAHATREYSFKDFVLNTCVKIASAGLELQLVPRTETSKHKVILLVRLPEQRFMEEYRKLVLRRWKQTGEGVTFRPIVDADGDGVDDTDGLTGHGARGRGLREVLNPTEADRIQLTALLLSKQQDRGGCGFGNIEHLEADENDDPRVVSIFPLHNKEWNRQLAAQWKSAFSLKARAKQFRTGTLDAIQRVCATFRSCGCVQSSSEPGGEDPSVESGYGMDPEDLMEREERERMRRRAVQDAIEAGRRKLRKTKSKALKNFAKQLAKPRGVTSDHEKFLTNVKEQYGERFAFLFAFNTACAESFTVLIYITFGLWVIQLFGSNAQSFWESYLRLSGLLGLLIPCVWGPAFLSRWDRMAHWYSNLWGSVGVTSIPAPSPFYRTPGQSDVCSWMKTVAIVLVSICAIILAVLAMFGLNIMIMELEILVQTAPLCGSWFYETVWKDYIAAGGKYTATKTNFLGHITNIVPDCYGGISEDPWGIHAASGWPGSGAWLWRGLMMVLVAAIEGIMIGVVYTEVFTCLALKLAYMLNKPLWQEHETAVINFTYPFECFAFISYFWVLAFIFIPSSTKFQAWLAENDHPLEISFNATINVTTTASNMIELWMHDKRYKNQIGPMILMPALVGANIPMVFEYLLPAMCVSWQRANRQAETDREAEDSRVDRPNGSKMSRCWKRCWRCCCTARCCCSICRMCRCCVLMCNCCMCDHDRGTSSELPEPALPDKYDDEMLANDATAAIQKYGRETHNSNLQRQEVVYHAPNARSVESEQADTVGLQDAVEVDGESRCTAPTRGATSHQLHRADDIIVESMLEPIDLPNEYRKVCIISLLVCMFTQVNLLVPVIGWFSLLIRFKFNFIRLAKYARRPVPHKPTSSDSTGGYRPWLEAQIFLSAMVTNLLFCLSTGQLEAWWALIDPQACQPPTLERTTWKYPNCDTTFVSEGMSYDTSDALYDETSLETEGLETEGLTRIMASNATCWQDPMPELNTDCPFAQTPGITDEWRAKSERTSSQSLHRLISFVVLQNLQVILLYTMIKWHHAKDGDIREKWKAARLAQHSLLADQLFPPEASDQIYSVVEATLARGRMKKRMEQIKAKVPITVDSFKDDSFIDAPHRQAVAKMGHAASSRQLVIVPPVDTGTQSEEAQPRGRAQVPAHVRDSEELLDGQGAPGTENEPANVMLPGSTS